MLYRLSARGVSVKDAQRLGKASFRLSGETAMTDLLILIRNVVLAMILAWLGLEFAPSNPDKNDDKPSERAEVASNLC